MWWRRALELIRAKPKNWFLLGVGFILCIYVPTVMLSYLSETLTFAWLVLQPCFEIGLISAAWKQARGNEPVINDLFNGFKANLVTLAGIGLALILLTLTISLFCETVWEKHFFEMMLNAAGSPETMQALLASPDFWQQILVYGILTTLVFLAGWLAPMVVVFQRANVAAAMLASLKAAFINWRAVSVYLITLIAACLAASFLMLILAQLPGGMMNIVLSAAMIIFAPYLFALFKISAFVAYCDIFQAGDRVFK
jgi:hypothetical protein